MTVAAAANDHPCCRVAEADSTEVSLTALERRLLNEFQKEFPLSPEPFADIAAELGIDTATVLTTLRRFSEQGLISRVGPVFSPNRIGASILAAVAVPDGDLQRVAMQISRRPEVNHNYEREHHFNLWFVVTAADQKHLDAVLNRIEQQTGYPLLRLPMLEDFHIDLGFSLHRSPPA